MLSEVRAADPPDSLRSFETFKAVIDKEAFGGVLHPCLLHNLKLARRQTRIRPARDRFHELTGGRGRGKDEMETDPMVGSGRRLTNEIVFAIIITKHDAR